ncbi:ribonuclease Z [Thermogladius sp. 4427co]|uniref:ribonuclease Z n=1 Tax=Thermogladius sp. 4427co TaxID=3450718 RepID=UPI003F7A0EAB
MNARLVFLGTGAAIPIYRGLPCISLKVNSNIYIFDIGEGCQQRMFKMGLSPLKVEAIFITHSHGDHFLGLFGLLQTMNLSDRRRELKIIAPKDLTVFIERILEGYIGKLGFPITVLDTEEAEIFQDNLITVQSYPVCHTVKSYGYLIRVGNKTISYTGDTAACDTTVEYSKNATILVHEATFTSEFEKEAREQGHSTARDAALIALKSNVNLLVLTHISSRFSDETPLLLEAYRYFKKSIVARDYMSLIL